MAENIKHNVSYPFSRNVLESIKASNSSVISGSGVNSSYSDYVFYNPTASQFQIGSAEVHIGSNAGAFSQGSNAVCLGAQAGRTSQGTNAVAIGYLAGSLNQRGEAVAVGDLAGQNTQGTNSVAVGLRAGNSSQGHNSVALGAQAGENRQYSGAIAVGYQAGQTGQGQYAVAVGALAGTLNQYTGSIVLNASGTELNSSSQGLYINPVRGTATATPVVVYNSTTKELTYNTSSLKYKDEVEDLDVDTSAVLRIRPRKYRSKIDGKNYVGLIAEEVNAIDTNFAWKEKGEPEGLEWFNMLLYLIAEVKKLNTRVNELDGQL